jgi:hypothetical protein
MNRSFHYPRTLGLAGALILIPAVTAAEAGQAAAPPGAGLNATEAEVLLNLFQEKGLISAQDVEKARAELARRATAATEMPPPSKLKLADWIKSLELYGDARLRYEYRGGEDLTGDHLERNRWRYRVRVGANFRFTDQLRAGMRLETGPGGRSSNVTFGDDAGPWGKDSDRIHLGLLFLSWEPASWFGATAGRQENPFKTTTLVWDHDLTPEGLSESFKYTVGKLDLFATFGQFVYDEANPDNPLGGASVTDAFLFGQQVGARFKVTPDISLQLAPTLYAYSGGGDSFNSTFVGTTAANSTGINDLLVLEIPAEVKWKLGKVPLRAFGDFAVNLEGQERAARAGFGDQDDQIYAYQAGLEIGSARKKGGWSLRGFWQRTDLFALDPNLVDSDLFDSRLNLEGFALQGIYAFTDFLTFSVTYAEADRANSALPTLGAGDLKDLNPLRHYRLLQADLSYKF